MCCYFLVVNHLNYVPYFSTSGTTEPACSLNKYRFFFTIFCSSIPSKTHANVRYVISLSCGRLNVPDSSRLYQMQYPVRSKYRIFIEVRVRFKNKNRCPLIGSSPTWFFASAVRRSNEQRISHASWYTYTRTAELRLSMFHQPAASLTPTLG